MKILFEDENLVAVYKPAGYLSVPSSQGKEDKRPVVGIELQNQLQTVLYPLHRLDFEVEGVLAFAKNSPAQKKLQSLWEQGKVRKAYRALSSHQDFTHWPPNVEGLLEGPPQSSPWISWLVAGKRRAFVAKHGLKSITHWKIINQEKEYLEWELEPVTGRRHQLRVELSRRGFPIWGDELYGSSIQVNDDRIALIAIQLEIEGYPTIKAEWSWDSWMNKGKK